MKVNVYADETIINKDEYIGIGCLFIPYEKREKFHKKLIQIRCLNNDSRKWVWDYEKCENECKKERHDYNNCEIHHNELAKKASYSQKEISKKWIKFLIENNKHAKDKIYFKILYIDLKKLDRSVFGDKNNLTNIYNRFFRTNLLGASAYFFKKQIEIEQIYHDKGDDKEGHDYFSWHLGHSIQSEANRLQINNEKIVFLDSDHKKYLNDEKLLMESQFIQLIDLILGTTTQTLFNTSTDPEKIKLSNIILPLVEKIINAPYDYESPFKHVQVMDIGVFPKNEINSTEDLYENITTSGEFHKDIKITKPTLPKGNSLLDW